jgi:hypothetical protein
MQHVRLAVLLSERQLVQLRAALLLRWRAFVCRQRSVQLTGRPPA